MAEIIAKWKIPQNLPDIQINIGGLMQQALFFQSLRTQEDQKMLEDFSAGNLSYEALDTYFTGRSVTAIGAQEKSTVATKQLTATEKHQDQLDLMQWNMFSDGHLSYEAFDQYTKTRLAEEKEGTTQYTRLVTNFGSATETTRKAEETLWKSQYENGQMSYTDYSKNLGDRAGLYTAGTTRNSDLQDKLLQITPEYQLQQSYNKYLRGDFSSDKDPYKNLQGYQNELRLIAGRFVDGSQQRSLIEQKISETGNQIIDYGIAQSLQDLSGKISTSYTEMTNAQNEFNNKKLLYEANPTPDNYNAWVTSYTNWQNKSSAFTTMTGTYNTKQSQLHDPTKFFTPIEIKNILGYQVQDVGAPTPQSTPSPTTPPAGSPPAGGTPPGGGGTTTPPPPASTPGLYKIPNPTYLPNFSEPELSRTGGNIFLTQSAYDARHVANATELRKYRSSEIFRIGSDIFLKSGVAKR